MREGAPVNKRSWKSKYIQKKKKQPKRAAKLKSSSVFNISLYFKA